jgi:hypothetical protein
MKKMESQIQVSLDSSQLVIIQKKLSLDNKIRSGVNWFFWIAGLSLINTIVYLFGGHFTFVVGLAATQIIDVFMSVLAKDFGTGGSIVRFIGFAIDIVIAGIFVVFGIFGKKRYRAAIIIGMILYAIDGVLLLLFQDFLGAGFHAFALLGIGGCLKSISELANLEKAGNSESIESIRQRMPSLQPRTTPQQWRTRLILVGMIVLVFIILFLFYAIVYFHR